MQLRPAFSAGFFYEGVAGKEIFGKFQQEGPRKSREATRKRRARQLGRNAPVLPRGNCRIEVGGNAALDCNPCHAADSPPKARTGSNLRNIFSERRRMAFGCGDGCASSAGGGAGIQSADAGSRAIPEFAGYLGFEAARILAGRRLRTFFEIESGCARRNAAVVGG